MNLKQLLFALLTATSISVGVAACSDEPANLAEAATAVCECIVMDPDSGFTQATCERDHVAPGWATATQACFDCVVEAADCDAMLACIHECPQLNDQ